MRFLARTGTLALCLATFSAARAADVDGVAAYANAHVITFSDVMSASRELQQRVSQQSPGAELNSLYLKALDDVINRKLIVDAYDDQKEIKIPDEVVDERVQNVIRDMFKDDRTAFLKALSEEGQTEAAWRVQIREQIVVNAMRNLRVDSQVRVSPLAVRERYDASPERYAQSASVKYSMIVISKGDAATQEEQKAKLEAAKAALAGGVPFADAARQFSEEPLAKDGGGRDWTAPDMLRKDLADFVMQAEPGALSEVIELGSNYVLLNLDERRAASKVTFESAYGDVERELRLEKSKQIYDEWIERLRRDSFVRVLNDKSF